MNSVQNWLFKQNFEQFCSKLFLIVPQLLQEQGIKYTPEIIEKAKAELKQKIGKLLDYLDEYNRKLFIVAKTLCYYKLESLPEYSFIIMPASKGFEGFIKKLCIDIDLIDPDYWKTNTTFGFLNDTKNPKRVALCAKDIKIDKFLKKISVNIDFFRHFMMHSEDSPTNRIDTFDDACKKLELLFSESKEIFDFFNDLFTLF